jgi:hypothetical protein
MGEEVMAWQDWISHTPKEHTLEVQKAFELFKEERMTPDFKDVLESLDNVSSDNELGAWLTKNEFAVRCALKLADRIPAMVKQLLKECGE